MGTSPSGDPVREISLARSSPCDGRAKTDVS
jgi:hypothetical protein